MRKMMEEVLSENKEKIKISYPVTNQKCESSKYCNKKKYNK